MEVTGVEGLVPMATTRDPALKCFSNECSFVGTGICIWNNSVFLRGKKNRGGCGRRYCNNHKTEMREICGGGKKTAAYTKFTTYCIECSKNYQKDKAMSKNCCCKSICLYLGICFLIIALVMGIKIAFLLSDED